MTRRTTWHRFLAAAGLLAAYAGWLIAGDSPLTRAGNAIGRLPELTPGFHSGEPQAALSRLGAARDDYLWMQAFDFLLVALTAMTALFAIALAARRPAAALAALQFLTLVPISYAAAELVENALLALFASGATAPAPTLVFVQQAATTIRLGLAALTVLLGFSFVAALGRTRSRVRTPRMTGWISKRLEKATWRGFAIWFAAWFLYNLWAINMDSPWTRALEAAGGKLPESQPGFPPIEPQRSLDALAAAGATGDYILWQALDIPYAIGNLMVTSIAIALALKAMHLEKSLTRYLLVLPPLYVICEGIENSLVTAFAAKLIAPDEAIVLVQQAATTLKLASGYGSMALALLSLCIAAAAAAIGAFRRRA